MRWKDTARPLSQCDSANRSDDISTNGAQCAQCCAVISSVCVMLFTQLVTLRSALLRLCMKLYTMFRSLLSHKMFVNFLCRMYCIYTPVGDSRLPSAVTDIFTIKILILLHVETLSTNRYRTTKEQVTPFNQWSHHLCGECS